MSAQALQPTTCPAWGSPHRRLTLRRIEGRQFPRARKRKTERDYSRAITQKGCACVSAASVQNDATWTPKPPANCYLRVLSDEQH